MGEQKEVRALVKKALQVNLNLAYNRHVHFPDPFVIAQLRVLLKESNHNPTPPASNLQVQ